MGNNPSNLDNQENVVKTTMTQTEFKEYQNQILKNAKHLGERFLTVKR